MSQHERRPDAASKPNGRGIDIAQKVAALALAVITVCGIILGAGNTLARLSWTERQIEANTKRLNELELWRREIYGTVIDNNAQHKRCEELIRELRTDIEKLELLIRNRP